MSNVVKYPGYSNIRVIYDNKDVTGSVNNVEWRGDIAQAYRSLTITLTNTYNGRTRLLNIEKGKELRFYHNDEFLFRGIVFSDEINSKGHHSVTAFDDNVYLTKVLDDRRFVNIKASDIARRLCNDFGVPVGSISDTGYVIPKLMRRSNTLYDMIIDALTITKKQTGRRFFIYNELGKFMLKERGERIISGTIAAADTLLDASYSQSIEDLKSQVKVVGGDDSSPITVTVKDDALIQRFGMMQHLEQVDEKMTKSQIEQRARELLRQLGTIDDEASVTALGNTKAVAGASMHIREPMTGIIGDYYIVTDTHQFSNGSYIVNLKLSATDDLPEGEVDSGE